MTKKIAIAGGGIFGSSAAIELGRRGHKVTLLEALPDLLCAASGVNQYRLHRGYHYPRSSETAVSCLRAERSFREWYGAGVRDDLDHYYCIAKEDSLTSREGYLKFCLDHGLEYESVDLPLVNPSKMALSVRVKEALVDIPKIRSLIWSYLEQADVTVELNRFVKPGDLDEYDYVIVACYAGINSIRNGVPDQHPNYQFELCEKPIVELDASFPAASIVVLDGPFMCIDPFGGEGTYVLGNVIEAIHATNIGPAPVIPEEYDRLLNRGVVANPAITNYDEFIRTGMEYIPALQGAKHVGSMFTVRTVLPYKDATDERPTLVKKIDDRTFSIFSGKLGTSVEAASVVADAIDGKSLAQLR